ncbi:hypothetical protein [Lactobacillus sp. B4005]|uniref:hypothetical protein n=1 Tax=Lactobacillus sp. B4005 TaxID=2818031 RepID=UPI00226A6E07|nr:hypothetical protein [Lactobacillus sp. B4005]MCX8723075.1 hypothetical protein [Lactobacillus sp. B4005]
MKIRNKKVFTIKDLEDGKTYSFDDDKIQKFGTRLNLDTKSVEYFIEVEDYDPLIISKKDFEQFKKYMKKERNVVWGNEDE